MSKQTNIPETLLAIFNSIVPLKTEVLAEIGEILEFKTLKKKELLLKEGQTSKHIYFIEKGLIRSFYTETDAEITTWFMKENDLIISVKSFYMQVPSTESLEAIEDCELYYISHQSLNALYMKCHSFNTIGRILTQHYYMLSEDRLLNLRKKEAITRYKHLLQYHPEIILRSPLKYIASYLGITIETLSRLRAKRI
ncbi:MAG: Crp/Fnr family transcriptional regulator [Flavobacterium sp.]|nr:Crp/Fnr family transcriptional regulator [Flavobacterium sp.]